MMKLDSIKRRLPLVTRWIKRHILSFSVAIVLLCLGCIAGVLLATVQQANSLQIFLDNDWTKGIATGVLTSLSVAILLDVTNKRKQGKRDKAIKRATMLRLMNNIINQTCHLMGWAHPLYHHVCDLDYLKEFIHDKVIPLEKECTENIRYYAALMDKEEFQALNSVQVNSRFLQTYLESSVFAEMYEKKKEYHLYYDYMDVNGKSKYQSGTTDLEIIQKNVSYTYRVLRDYLQSLEDAIDALGYIFDDDKSYENLYRDIEAMDALYISSKN